MRVIILGTAAGGGVPQWNCACPNCTDARHDNRGRTQSCVAVSADGERGVLLNASPDLRTQLAAHHELWPRGRRGSGIAAGLLTDGEIDHTLGGLLMRESDARLPVYAPAGVAAHHELWPRGRRGSGIAAVILTDGEIDHTLGLLLMRESAARLPVYAPAGVAALLDGAWPLYRVLAAYSGVEPRVLDGARAMSLTDQAGG